MSTFILLLWSAGGGVAPVLIPDRTVSVAPRLRQIQVANRTAPVVVKGRVSKIVVAAPR